MGMILTSPQEIRTTRTGNTDMTIMANAGKEFTSGLLSWHQLGQVANNNVPQRTLTQRSRTMGCLITEVHILVRAREYATSMTVAINSHH